MKIIVSGVVQGVGFRPTVYRVAKGLNLRGYVLNKGSEVEICIDRDLDKFLNSLNKSLPPVARIENIKIEHASTRAFNDFLILDSEDGARTSATPVDTAICKDCLKELFDESDRRYLYPFTNCTNCGERFSAIKNIPYDRERTSMHEFKLCKECRKEYKDPAKRRFHAQAISCPTCGPKYTFYEGKNNSASENAIERFAECIDEGAIGVVKSWGGMHLCCRAEEIKKFRKWYRREQKPFAVMVRNIDTAKKYAIINRYEEELMTSPQTPILIVRSCNAHNDVLEGVAPGLGNIGIYLPYTALHHVLFHYLNSDAVIMTSANIPDEPMIIRNEDAFSLNADCYLLHNRAIINRADDTVIKPYGKSFFFIRKSRGFIPNVIKVPYKENIVGVGAERDVTSTLSTNGNLYSSQYIGNSRYYGTIEFLEQSINWLVRLCNLKNIDGVGIDLHPRYNTRNVGKLLAERYNAELLEIQHHWAHACSLMLENQLDSIVALTLDGAGYGSDGTIWGGEVLISYFDSFKRVASLEQIPLIGGDAAAKDPRRIVFAIFDKLGKELYFHGKDAEILRKLSSKSPVTSSFGRILDALSCYLGICESRTYEGEPAMKLEKYLDVGKPKYNFKAELKNNTVITTELFRQLSYYAKESLADNKKADLAYSFVKSLVEALASIAVEKAYENNIECIGLTGGVSYNIPITELCRKFVEKKSLKFVTHSTVPNGDGGISIGQNVIAGYKISKSKEH
ncbi:MAG: carbamoyltransferase HypF [Candidatus Thermoplasmatota archaeon]|nr:carbamoyltransferase HypF [Candidatus Thermoplasmatota archaeon]